MTFLLDLSHGMDAGAPRHLSIRSRLAIATLSLLLSAPAVCAQDAPLRVAAKALNSYWLVDVAATPAQMPPITRSIHPTLQQHGRVTLDFEYTINAQGVPVDFQFKSIQPEGIDPKPFIAQTMFFRYKPGPDNPEGRPVRVYGPVPHYIPERIQPESGAPAP